MTEKVVMAGVVIATYLLMLLAFYRPQQRTFHIYTMVFIMLFDLAVPVYLFLRRDWYVRLFEHGDISSFLVWMHFIMPLALYILYIFQILAARKLLQGDADGSARIDHRGQAKAILVVRALTIFTGILLIEPDPA